MHRRDVLCSFVGLSLCLLASSSFGAEISAEKLSEIGDKMQAKMQQYVDAHVVSGAVTVVGFPEATSIRAVGQRDIEASAPMDIGALFRIASMTKPITAIGIMILVDEGKLNVNDPVEKHLPEFKGQKLIVSREGGKLKLGEPQRPITVRDLLTHTSGLPGGWPAPHEDLYFKRKLTLKEAVAISAKLPLEFEPGSKWSYCNAGIDTLGRIIEVLSGEAYEDFLKKRIFDPLKMENTSFYPTEAQLQELAGLYDSKNDMLKNVGFSLIGPTKDARHPIPAGGLFSTADDLSKLYQMMLKRGKVGSQEILSEKSVAEMTKVQTGELECGFTPGMGFGYGWAVVRKPQGVHAMMSAGTFGHGGAFGTQAWIDPHQGLFVILLIQRVGLPNADASDLRRDLQTIAVDSMKKP